MTIATIAGSPPIMVGAAWRPFGPLAAPSNGAQLDAALEAAIFFGQVFTEDAGSHTVSVDGTSSLGWLTASVTFANAGTTVTVGIATMDAATGPPARATNVANAITFSASKTLTGGGGGITGSAWQEHIPDTGAPLTVNHGDYIAFAIQMVTVGGADLVQVAALNAAGNYNWSGYTTYVGGAYAASLRGADCVITFSDGTYGFFHGSLNFVTRSSLTFNSGSATKEYGNYFKAPFPMSIAGLYATGDFGNDFDLVFYTDPLGTPVAQRTISVDNDTVPGSAADTSIIRWFSTPYETTTNQEIAAILKPGASNITAYGAQMNAAGHQKQFAFGANGYTVSRATGAFAAVNSNKDRCAIGLVLNGFDSGGGGAAGLMYRNSMTGNV